MAQIHNKFTDDQVKDLFEKYINPDMPVGFASILVAISMCCGIQLIMLGMAERIYRTGFSFSQ